MVGNAAPGADRQPRRPLAGAPRGHRHVPVPFVALLHPAGPSCLPTAPSPAPWHVGSPYPRAGGHRTGITRGLHPTLTFTNERGRRTRDTSSPLLGEILRRSQGTYMAELRSALSAATTILARSCRDIDIHLYIVSEPTTLGALTGMSVNTYVNCGNAVIWVVV